MILSFSSKFGGEIRFFWIIYISNQLLRPLFNKKMFETAIIAVPYIGKGCLCQNYAKNV